MSAASEARKAILALRDKALAHAEEAESLFMQAIRHADALDIVATKLDDTKVVEAWERIKKEAPGVLSS